MKRALKPLSAPEIDQLLAAELGELFSLLGLHRRGEATSVRCYFPGADAVTLCHGDLLIELEHEHEAGLFVSHDPSLARIDSYHYTVHYPGGTQQACEDPYRFSTTLNEEDTWLFAEGRQQSAWRFMGARSVQKDGVEGTQFAVWAPNAHRVAVIGDFNHYDTRTHVMRHHSGSGIWEMFVPGPGVGAKYRFDIIDAHGVRRQKADPFARAMSDPADTIAVVCADHYEWHDDDWLRSRNQGDALTIYEVHAGSWRRHGDGRFFSYRELADTLVPYVADLGFTHLEFLPITEHPFSGSWGYQPLGLYAPSARFGSPDDLRYLIDTAHQQGIGVILDWVPAHFPGDDHGLLQFDGTALYEHADPRQGRHPDWGTFIFNYSRAEVISYLVSNALYWIDEFHFDGLRVDAVASMLYLDYSRGAGEWLPNQFGGRENLEAVEFLKTVNGVVHSRHPDILTIAEESTAWPGVSSPTADGGLGFDYKWNMGWMHDTLTYLAREPVHRQHHHHEITFSMVYAFSERFTLPLSHDEVVHGKGALISKMPGDNWQRFATLRLMLAYMWTHPGAKLLFMGGEFGQRQEWNHDAELDWPLLEDERHSGVQKLVRDLNVTYRQETALQPVDSGFDWLDVDDSPRSLIAFARTGGAAPIIVCVNFTPVVRTDYELALPEPGDYREIINTDSEYYGGTNVGNTGTLHTYASDGIHRLRLTLPPLAVLLLRPVHDIDQT